MLKFLKKLFSSAPEFTVRPRITPEELAAKRRQQAARDAAWRQAWDKNQQESLARIARRSDAEGDAE